MSGAFAVAIVLLAQGTSPAPLAESWTACKATSADVVIEGCTAVILAGTDTPQDLATAYHLRANAHRARHLLDLAMQDYDEAIKLDPHLIDAVGNRGITLIVMGRFADAIPDLTKVMEADPKSAYATYDRGLAYEALGLTDLAIEDFSAAIAQQPPDAHRLERRGTMYFRKGEYAKALADYEQALVVDPQYAPALYGRGILKRMNGDAAGGGADVAAAKHFQSNIDAVMAAAGVKEH